MAERLADLDHHERGDLGHGQLAVAEELLEGLAVDELGNDVRVRSFVAGVVEDLQDAVVV